MTSMTRRSRHTPIPMWAKLTIALVVVIGVVLLIILPTSGILAWLLILAGLLPILTAFVLRRYRDTDSQSLRDRWQVAVVLAVLGGVTMILAANRVVPLGFDQEWVLTGFALTLLAVDLVSAKWLIAYYSGTFVEEVEHAETAIEREDRVVGDVRRDLQAKAADEEES